MKIEKLAITALQCHLTIVTHWLCNKLNMKQTLDTEELGLQCVGVNKLFTEICKLLHHKLKGRSCVHVIAKVENCIRIFVARTGTTRLT